MYDSEPMLRADAPSRSEPKTEPRLVPVVTQADKTTASLSELFKSIKLSKLNFK